MKLKKSLLLILIINLMCSCVENESQSNEKKINLIENNITKDASYYLAKGFQVYPEFNLAVKFPCKLKDASLKTPGNNDLSLAGFDNKKNSTAFYQVMIKNFPLGYRNSSPEKKQEVANYFFSSFQNVGERKFVIFNNLKAAVITYSNKNLSGMALIFIKNEQSFVFNLLSSDNIVKRFNSMTNNIIFYNNTDHDAKKINNIDTIQLMKKIIQVALTPDNPKIIKTDIINDSLFTKYSNEKNSFSIFYPKDWNAIKNFNQMIAFTANDKLDAETNFNIIVIPNEERTLEEVFKANKKEMEMYIKGVKFIDNGKTKILNNLKYKKIISDFINPESGIKQRTITYSFVKNSKSYIVTFSTNPSKYNKNLSLYESIINTFKIN